MVLLLPCACRGWEEEDFKSFFFPAILLLFPLPLAHKTRTQAILLTLPPLITHAL